MRISDWSSDVCSSDLNEWGKGQPTGQARLYGHGTTRQTYAAAGRNSPKGWATGIPGALGEMLTQRLHDTFCGMPIAIGRYTPRHGFVGGFIIQQALRLFDDTVVVWPNQLDHTLLNSLRTFCQIGRAHV